MSEVSAHGAAEEDLPWSKPLLQTSPQSLSAKHEEPERGAEVGRAGDS